MLWLCLGIYREGAVLGDSLLSCSYTGCDLGGSNIGTYLFLGFMITLKQFYTVCIIELRGVSQNILGGLRA